MALPNERSLPRHGHSLINLIPGLNKPGIYLENTMFLKNVAARLITINTPDGKSYDIIPAGPAVEVKGDLGIAQEFVDALIESGDLVEAASEKAVVKEAAKASNK